MLASIDLVIQQLFQYSETVSGHAELVSGHGELVSGHSELVSESLIPVTSPLETLKQVQGDVQGDLIRHAELVSTTCLSTGDDLLLGKPIRSQVAKFWILCFYEIPLPSLMPVLQLLLSVNSILHPLDFFKIHKVCQMVHGSEYRTATALVLKDPSLQVARHPYVKCGSVQPVVQ